MIDRQIHSAASYQCSKCKQNIANILQLCCCTCGKFYHKKCVNKLELPGNAMLLGCTTCNSSLTHSSVHNLDYVRDREMADNMSQITINNYKSRVRTLEKVMAIHLHLKHADWLSQRPVPIHQIASYLTIRKTQGASRRTV